MNYHDQQNENEKQIRYQQNKMNYDLKTTSPFTIGPFFRQPQKIFV